MTEPAKAASPVPSVRDALREALGWHLAHGDPATTGTDWTATQIEKALGVDPEMSVETIRRQLLVGERVETYWVDEGRELHADPVAGHLVCGEGGVMYMAEALLRQLTRLTRDDYAFEPHPRHASASTIDEARLAMTTQLHDAVFGEVWARPEPPHEVWQMLLARIRDLTTRDNTDSAVPS